MPTEGNRLEVDTIYMGGIQSMGTEISMTEDDQKRLARIRSQNLQWGAWVDTSTWETTFLLGVIDYLRRLIEKDPPVEDPARCWCGQPIHQKREGA